MEEGGSYRGRGRGGRGGRGRFSGRGGRGEGRGRGERRPDPQPCPIMTDEQGRLKIKITCLIMRDFAGAVIGRGGEHVTDIRKESGALIHVCKPDFSTGIQGVDLFGTLQQVGAAHAKLSTILSENAGDWCDDAKWGARVKLFLLPDMASIVIGKKGATVQRIIKESNAGVRVSNEADVNNLQSCQIFGTNNDAATAFALLVEVLSEYNAADSRSIPRLKDAWEQRRAAEMYGPQDGYGAGAGGLSPDRGRYGSYGQSSDSRYEPYPRSSGRMHGGGGSDEVSAHNMVVMPNAVQVPNIPGGMPTVLIQQADGSLVQAQVVTQAGGQYTVQPATAQQGAVQQLKTTYGSGAPLTTSATGSVGPQQPQQAVSAMGQMLIPGPGGVMYAAAPADGSQSMQQAAPQMSYTTMQGGMQQGANMSGGAATGYQVTSGSMQMAGSVTAQPQAADPMAYAKLQGYGQQGAKPAANAQYSVAAAGGPVYAPAGSAPMSSMSYAQQGGIYGAPVGGGQYAQSSPNSQYSSK